MEFDQGCRSPFRGGLGQELFRYRQDGLESVSDQFRTGCLDGT
jgi:hypothetical protein